MAAIVFLRGQYGDLAKGNMGKRCNGCNEEKEEQYLGSAAVKFFSLYTAQSERAHVTEITSSICSTSSPLVSSFSNLHTVLSQFHKTFCLKCSYMILFIPQKIK